MMKIDCSRHLRTEQTKIVTPWAPVGAKIQVLRLDIFERRSSSIYQCSYSLTQVVLIASPIFFGSVKKVSWSGQILD